MKRWLLLLALLPSLAFAQTANLWIDTNGGTCTRQGTPATYVDAAACSSMQTALAACTAGDTIRMKAGTYGGQTITATKTSPGCTIIAETNTNLNDSLITTGAWYEIQNINVSNGSTATGYNLWHVLSGAGAHDITCRNCNFDALGGGAQITWTDATNISWIGGSFKNQSSNLHEPAAFFNEGQTGLGGGGYLTDGVTFDNISKNADPTDHYEVIRIDGVVDGVTVRNSTFTNNNTDTSTIFMSTLLGNKPINLLFENNFFGSTGTSFYHFQENLQGVNCQNWTFRYNTFKFVTPAQISDGDCPSRVNVVWTGNIGTGPDCASGNTYTNNVWFGGSGCSGSDIVVTLASLNFDTDGFHILTGSSAIGAGGTGGNCIATDHDGNSRTSPCDAGAIEFGAGGSVPSAPSNFRTAWMLMRREFIVVG